MKNQLEVTLLGYPSVYYNDTKLSFPYRQAEAVFFYLLINKNVNKYTMADIIWGDKFSEEKINSNLRNAFYVLRKLLGKNFLTKTSGDIISIDREFHISTDLENFLSSPDTLSLYTDDFLKDFYLKNNTLFNEWVSNTRQALKNFYLEKLHSAIIRSFEEGNLSECERLCHQQIQMNEFDETAYKYLMQTYLERKNYTLALNIYEQLERLFEQELFEQPGKEIRELAYSVEETLNQEVAQLLESKKEIKTSSQSPAFFYGREKELELLKRNFCLFLEDRTEASLRHLLIIGEAGIGKTGLLEHWLSAYKKDDTFLLLQTHCYFAEEKYILKPWNNPARQLLAYLNLCGLEECQILKQSIGILFPFLREEFPLSEDDANFSSIDYKSVQNVFVNAVIQLSGRKKLVFYFDDIINADELSISLIRDLMTGSSNRGCRNILFLLTARNQGTGEFYRLLEDMNSLRCIETVTLSRFDFDDTINMTSLLLPEYSFTEAVQRQLFRETEGNPFFITETVNNIKYNGSPDEITPNMLNIIKQRISPVPGEYRSVLDLVSIFFDGASFDCLSFLSHKEDYELMEILEYLLRQNLLKEAWDQDNTFFSLTHQKIQEYIYEDMSWTKKRILHNKAGAYYENKLRGNVRDMAWYPKLIYHFEHGANQQKYLKYAVKYLYNYLNVTHEFFPVIENNLTLVTLDMRQETRECLSGDMGIIEGLLASIERKIENDELLLDNLEGDREQVEILSDYLHMVGRHYIRTCSYEKGLKLIQHLKAVNLKYTFPFRLDKLLQANRQLICIYINRCEPKKMKEVIEDSLALLSTNAPPEEIAIWERMQGLYHIMSGDTGAGIRILTKAIHTFEQSKKQAQYLYNLAAAYAWMGEAYRFEASYEEAIRYYELAITTCRQNFLVSGIAIFYAYEGMAAYDSHRCDLAREKLQASMEHYEGGSLMWGRSLACSYYAQILLRDGRFEQASQLLKTAMGFASKLECPYELGIIYRIYAGLKRRFPENRALRNSFAADLPESYAYYKEKTLHFLSNVYSPLDKALLSDSPAHSYIPF